MIKVLFFGRVADSLDLRVLNLDVNYLSQLCHKLQGQFIAAGLEMNSLSISVNQVLVRGDMALNNGDEVAFFTNFSGG
jgi:molybdopterin converting factor small subunit